MAIFNKRPVRPEEEDYDRRYYDEQDDDMVEDTEAPAGSNIGFGGVNLGGGGIELKVVRPEHFEDVSTIADHLLSGRTVVLNLEATNKDVARRFIDFLSGVAYSIDGQMKRVANNTYIITPNNVDVTDTALRGESGADDED
ncbi:MAG: cell division protein SepF [Clostridia bacterium]|nr:cell division protein SepF [Clostridia bacterium]